MSDNLTQQEYNNLIKRFLESNAVAFRKFASEYENDHNTKYLLNVEATQFTIGKTEKALSRVAILNAARLHQLNNDDDDITHSISIIISSCNLAETEQWKIRCKNKFGRDLNIATISSKEKKNRGGSGNKIDNFIKSLALLDKNNLPNILLMCCHSQRINNDLIELLESQRRLGDANWDFKFNLFIDEADKNIELVTKSLDDIRRRKLNVNVLNEVHFITATPSLRFWKCLKNIGIDKLDNFDIAFGDGISKEKRLEAEKRYQSILTQEFEHFDHPHLTLRAFDYIKYAMHMKVIDLDQRQILFVPGENKVSSHNNIRDYFLKIGFHVLYHNGKFKGFIFPNGEKISIDDFRKKYNIPENKELREVLVKWNEIFPNHSLAITGYATVVRGLTFNTTGFNFTHMIFSSCHTKNLADFVQLLGRACGNKNYCRTLKIIGLKKPFENAKNFVQNILDLKKENLEKFDSNMFKINKKNVNTAIEKFKSKEEAITKLKAVFHNKGQNRYPKFKSEQNEAGYHLNLLRTEKRVMSYDYVVRNRGWGIGSKNYRTHMCYEDINNKDTLVYVICYPKEYEITE